MLTWSSPRGYLRAMDANTLSAAVMGLAPARAALWATPVTAAFDAFGVDTLDRQAAFLAQCGHESAGFGITREIWGPTPAQSGYEGRADLGNLQPGDGSKFRGRGLIQITGRANYAACADALGLDLLNHPELLEAPDGASRSAGWFWQTYRLNQYADSGDFETLTRRINGGLNGLADRELRWSHAKAALGV
jgi:putative chitinase